MNTLPKVTLVNGPAKRCFIRFIRDRYGIGQIEALTGYLRIPPSLATVIKMDELVAIEKEVKAGVQGGELQNGVHWCVELGFKLPESPSAFQSPDQPD